MSRAIITESLLTGIANAIRSKLSSSDEYTPEEMATAVSSIPTGITPSGSISITENDTYDVTSYASAVVNVPTGGGATNIVQGTFVGTTTGAAMSVDPGYTGNGYPIACIVWPDGGLIGNTAFYDTIQRYAAGMYTMTKSYTEQAPTYATSGEANQATVQSRYKNSASSATSFTNGASQTANIFSSSSAVANSTTCLRFRSNGTMSVFIASTSYGFMANITYRYIIVYSE